MSLSRHLLRRAPSGSAALRHFSTSPATATSETESSHRHHHDFLPPTSYINSWKRPRNPKEANQQLAFLRRDYDRKVKEIRKEYIKEVELQRIEKLRKDEARKEALRIANEEKRAAKAEKKKAEAIERQAAEEEFRQMLVCEIAFLPLELLRYLLFWFRFNYVCNAAISSISRFNLHILFFMYL